MELKSFSKQVLNSAQETFNHELEARDSEIHKTTEHLLDAVMKKLIKVSSGILAILFLLIGVVFGLNTWFDIPLWGASFIVAGIAAAAFLLIRWD